MINISFGQPAVPTPQEGGFQTRPYGRPMFQSRSGENAIALGLIGAGRVTDCSRGSDGAPCRGVGSGLRGNDGWGSRWRILPGSGFPPSRERRMGGHDGAPCRGVGSRLRGNDGWGSRWRILPGMDSRLRGNDGMGMGSRLRGNDGRGWVPVCTGTTGWGWVPAFAGTTEGDGFPSARERRKGMGSRLHGNDGRGWVPAFAGTTECRDW